MIATPIGNLDDITMRALDILKRVDVIACEDTRHTQNLLNRFDIHKRLIACHAPTRSIPRRGSSLCSRGHRCGLCERCGYAGCERSGGSACRCGTAAGFSVVPVPGVSAVTTLVSVAGFVGKSFTFEGFLSPRKGRRTARLRQLLERDEAFVVYESPFRVVKLLRELDELAPSR